MSLPYPVDPATPSLPSPYFTDTSFVRGDIARGNNTQIWANFLDLDSRTTTNGDDITAIEAELVTIEQDIADLQVQTIANGLNTGGIVFNSSALPPSVQPGVYDVAGTRVAKTSQTALSLTTNVFKKSSQALGASRAYHVAIDTAGDLYWLLAMGPAVAAHTGSITSITQFSGTATLTAASGTISGDAGNIIVVSGTTQFDGVYVIATNGGVGVCTFLTSGNVNTGAVGTYTIYSALSVTSSANMALALNPTLNGYYLNADGVNSSGAATYRVLGRWFTNATPNTTYCVPFGNGAQQGAQFSSAATNQGVIVIQAATTAPTKGTTSVDTYSTEIRGGMLRMWGSYRQSGGSPGAGSGTYYLAIPESVGNLDTSNVANNAGGAEGAIGRFTGYNSFNGVFVGNCTIISGKVGAIFFIAGGSISGGNGWGSSNLDLGQSPLSFGFDFEVPLVGYL